MWDRSFKKLKKHCLLNFYYTRSSIWHTAGEFSVILIIWGGGCHKTELFVYFGFYIPFNTVRVISRRVVGRAEETSTYSSFGFCTVNCRPMASNYQLSYLRPCQESNPGLTGGRRECYHSATVALVIKLKRVYH